MVMLAEKKGGPAEEMQVAVMVAEKAVAMSVVEQVVVKVVATAEAAVVE